MLESMRMSGGGTRLTLWHSIDRRFISWGAAGSHISFDVLDRHLSGIPIARIAGPDAMKFGGWQRLNAECAEQFGIEPPRWCGSIADLTQCGQRCLPFVPEESSYCSGCLTQGIYRLRPTNPRRSRQCCAYQLMA